MLGDEILRQRTKLGYTITELSKRTGVSDATISALELHQKKFVLKETFEKLSTVLDLEQYKKYIYLDYGKLLGMMIREKRLEHGYTQTELAEKCHYADKSAISHIERGKHNKITEETFKKLQPILRLEEEDFIPFIENTKENKQKARIQMINQELIQQLVKTKRKSLKLTQVALANKAQISYHYVEKIENHPEKKVPLNVLLCIMETLSFTEEEKLECLGEIDPKPFTYQKKK